MLKMKKTLNYMLKAVSVLLLVFIAVNSLSVCAAAKTSYISELTVAVGAEGRSSLESSGYSVLFQGMNLVSDEDSMVFLGYKKGSSAITNLVVSTQRSSSVTYGGCTYTLVSSVSLNSGTGGTPLYLYYTKDSSAGGMITSLDTASGFSDTDEVISLRNDGSSPVSMSDGTLANLDSGIANSEIYLLMYRSASIRRYISNVCIVTGSSKAEAVNRAASQGCDYYLDNDIGGSSSVSYIAYRRTSEAGEAITELSITDSGVQLEKDGQSGAYLLDITSGRLFDESFELGEWAGIYASYDRAVSRSSSQYKALAAATDACSCVLAGEPEIYALYEGSFTAAAEEEPEEEAEEEPGEEPAEEDTEETGEAAADGSAAEPGTETEQTAGQDTETETTGESVTDVPDTGGSAMDEFYGIDKTEDTPAAEEDTDTEVDAVASVINRGNIVAISCLSIIAVLVIVGVGIYMRSRSNKAKNQ